MIHCKKVLNSSCSYSCIVPFIPTNILCDMKYLLFWYQYLSNCTYDHFYICEEIFHFLLQIQIYVNVCNLSEYRKLIRPFHHVALKRKRNWKSRQTKTFLVAIVAKLFIIRYWFFYKLKQVLNWTRMCLANVFIFYFKNCI